MTEIADKKTMKRLVRWQKEALDNVKGYEYLLDVFADSREYAAPIRKIMEERQRHADTLGRLTGLNPEGTQSDVKILRRTYRIFKQKRVFKLLHDVMKEAAREHTEWIRDLPKLKPIVAEEKRESETFERLMKMSEKSRKLK